MRWRISRILHTLAMSAALATTVVLTLYIASDDVQRLCTTPEVLWLICPLMLYWTTRMIMMAHRFQMTDDPILFSLRDRISLIVIATCICLAVLGSVVRDLRRTFERVRRS